jgi:hypothetical protein
MMNYVLPPKLLQRTCHCDVTQLTGYGLVRYDVTQSLNHCTLGAMHEPYPNRHGYRVKGVGLNAVGRVFN